MPKVGCDFNCQLTSLTYVPLADGLHDNDSCDNDNEFKMTDSACSIWSSVDLLAIHGVVTAHHLLSAGRLCHPPGHLWKKWLNQLQDKSNLPIVDLWRHAVSHGHGGTGNESVPIQLAQCWFPGLAISNADLYFSHEVYGSSFIKQHSETVMVWNYQNSHCSLIKINVLCYLL